MKGEVKSMIRFDSRTKHFRSHLEDRLQSATLESVLVQEGNDDGLKRKYWQWEAKQWDRRKRYLKDGNND